MEQAYEKACCIVVDTIAPVRLATVIKAPVALRKSAFVPCSRPVAGSSAVAAQVLACSLVHGELPDWSDQQGCQLHLELQCLPGVSKCTLGQHELLFDPG